MNGSKEFEKGAAYQSEDITIGNHSTQKATFGQKAKRHCARWWWLHLIIFCVIFLAVALIVVYVGFPRIAQQGVNDASLEIIQMSFLEPTADSLIVNLQATLNNPTIYTPTLEGFNATLHLLTNGTYSETGMVTLPLPDIHVLKPSSNTTVDHKTAQILDEAELAKFATQVVSNENITTTLVGQTKLHLGALPVANVNLNLSATYKGLNGLKGFNTTDLRLNLTALAGTPNLRGNAFIPNPSVITVAMGNVTLSLSTALEGIVGNATIQNFTLVPGNNSLPMVAIVDQPKIIKSLDGKGFVNMTIKGTSAVYNGVHLAYYEAALASNVLELQMNVAQILADSASGK